MERVPDDDDNDDGEKLNPTTNLSLVLTRFSLLFLVCLVRGKMFELEMLTVWSVWCALMGCLLSQDIDFFLLISRKTRF